MAADSAPALGYTGTVEPSEKDPDEGGAADKGGAAPEDRARRRLLSLVFYVPPAVLGTLAVTNAGCQTVSCSPSQCQPGQCAPADCAPGQCPPVACNPNRP
jgi:hypothetical protein